MAAPLPAPDLDHVLLRVGASFEELRGARLFVTGGTGFVGRWLLESLAAADARLGLGVDVTVLTRDPDGFARRVPGVAGNRAFHLLAGDVRTFDFPEGAFTHVIHGAAESSTTLARDQPATMVDVLVRGTGRVLDLARERGARRVLFVSSGAVYGRILPAVDHVPEAYPGGPDPTSPAAAYGEGKRLAELLCCLAARNGGPSVSIARCFAFVGPGLPLDAHFAIGNFLRDALAGGPIRVQGDGTPLRSYLHAADLAAWLWVVLLRGASGRAYNVGSQDSRSIREVAEVVARSAGIAGRIDVAFAPVAGVAPERYVPDTARAREELGLETWISFEDAVSSTLAWLRAAPTSPA
jgi:dTDP-glucose 4,6-dehydratase